MSLYIINISIYKVIKLLIFCITVFNLILVFAAESPLVQPQDITDNKEDYGDNHELIPGFDTPYSPHPSPPASPMPYEYNITTSKSLFPDYIYGLDTPLSPSKLSP